VATVDDLEKGDLRVAREVNVLRTISYKLHKATSCHLVYTCWEEKIVEKCRNGGKSKLFENLDNPS